MRWTWIPLVVSMACVTKGRHELIEVQLDATRIALSARAVQCQQDVHQLEADLAASTYELVLRQIQLEELGSFAGLRDAEVERLQGEVVALADELTDGRAEIARLAEALEATKPRRRDTPEPPPDAEDPEPLPPTEGDRALAELQSDLQAHYQASLREAALDRAHATASDAFWPLVDAGHAEILRVEDATVVRIETHLLFQEGWTLLSPRGEQIVGRAADALQQLPGRRVAIEAHTDDRPVHSAAFASNWEKGFGRAVSVLRVFEAADVPAILSATSHAGTRPVADGTTEAGRKQNRRVELVIRVDPTLVGPQDG